MKQFQRPFPSLVGESCKRVSGSELFFTGHLCRRKTLLLYAFICCATVPAVLLSAIAGSMPSSASISESSTSVILRASRNFQLGPALFLFSPVSCTAPTVIVSHYQWFNAFARCHTTLVLSWPTHKGRVSLIHAPVLHTMCFSCRLCPAPHLQCQQSVGHYYQWFNVPTQVYP